MRAGSKWRFLAHGKRGNEPIELKPKPGQIFDELVVDGWFHIEQMDTREWWMRVGNHVLWVTVGKEGKASKVTCFPPGEYEAKEEWTRNQR